MLSVETSSGTMMSSSVIDTEVRRYHDVRKGGGGGARYILHHYDVIICYMEE